MDGSGNGRPPDPWHVPCKPDQLFHNHTKTVNVPHTEVIKASFATNFIILLSQLNHKCLRKRTRRKDLHVLRTSISRIKPLSLYNHGKIFSLYQQLIK